MEAFNEIICAPSATSRCAVCAEISPRPEVFNICARDILIAKEMTRERERKKEIVTITLRNREKEEC